jgi:hypothetical protein
MHQKSMADSLCIPQPSCAISQPSRGSAPSPDAFESGDAMDVLAITGQALAAAALTANDRRTRRRSNLVIVHLANGKFAQGPAATAAGLSEVDADINRLNVKSGRIKLLSVLRCTDLAQQSDWHCSDVVGSSLCLTLRSEEFVLRKGVGAYVIRRKLGASHAD